MYCLDPLLLKDVTHACWEAVQPMVVDFPDAWLVWSRIDATGTGGFHGSLLSLEHASFALANLHRFSRFFVRGSYNTKVVKLCLRVKYLVPQFSS